MSRVLMGLFTSALLVACALGQDQPPATPATVQQGAPPPPPEAYAQPAPAPGPRQPGYVPPPPPPELNAQPSPIATPAPPPPAARVIQVVSATYGASCGVPTGNVTEDVARQCNGLVRCSYRIDRRIIGDPVYACAKDYAVEWLCSTRTFRAYAPGEAGAGDKVVTLSCDPAFTGPMR